MKKILYLPLILFLISGKQIYGENNDTSPENEAVAVAHNQNDFFFRVNIGYGYSKGTLYYQSGDITETDQGITGLYNLQIGYTVLNNFIVFTEIGTTATQNSKILVNGAATDLELAKFNIPALGLGAMYFFMPLNFYILAEIRMPQLIYTIKLPSGYNEYDSKFGFGAGLSAGIELMPGKSWATGLAVTFLYDFPVPEYYAVIGNISDFYIGLSATITYN